MPASPPLLQSRYVPSTFITKRSTCIELRKRIISGLPMSRSIDLLPRVAIFLVGVAAGALTGARRDRGGMDPTALKGLKDSLSGLETRLAAQETASANRFTEIETRLDEHSSKLAEVPSTSQFVAAMEQLLAKTMSSLDERLSTQAHSIEVRSEEH